MGSTVKQLLNSYGDHTQDNNYSNNTIYLLRKTYTFIVRDQYPYKFKSLNTFSINLQPNNGKTKLSFVAPSLNRVCKGMTDMKKPIE